MLKKLFRRTHALNDQEAEVRLAAVVALTKEDAAAYQQDLLTLARQDPDVRVRLAAITQMILEEDLTLLMQNSPAAVAQAAAIALAEIYLTKTSGKIPSRPHPRLRDALLRLAPEPSLVLSLLEEITTSEHLIQLSLECRCPEIRQAAAAKIHQESDLSRLEKLSRNHDKKINRYCREGLNEIRNLRSEQLEIHQRMEQLSERAQQLAADRSGSHKQHRLDSLQRAATAVSSDLESNERKLAERGIIGNKKLGSDIALMLQQSLLEAQVALREILRTISEPKIQGRPTATQPQMDPNSRFQQLLESMQDLEQSFRAQLLATSDPDVAALTSTRTNLEAQWFALSESAPHDHQLFDDFQTIVHRLLALESSLVDFPKISQGLVEIIALNCHLPDSLERRSTQYWQQLWQRQKAISRALKTLQGLFAKLQWPDSYPLFHSARTVKEKEQNLKAFLLRTRSLADELRQQVVKRLEQLEMVIQDGRLKEAPALSERIRSLLDQLPESSRRTLQGQYRSAQTELRELRDWQTFATNPKREALCVKIEELRQRALAPVDQGVRIKQLRKQWQNLGPISSRSDHLLLERFNKAAQQAFEPCRIYYAEQAALRNYNQQQRSKICYELAHYLESTDWQHANWKAAQEILFKAKNEWHRFHPVERNRERELQTNFQKLWDTLYEKIDGQYRLNLQHKHKIVEQAAAVLASDDSNREKIIQIKKLQSEWQQVGITNRRADQQLWKKFRTSCDAIFEAREVDKERLQQSLMERKQQAETVCEEFANTLANTSAAAADPQVLGIYRQRFGELYTEDAAADCTRQNFPEPQLKGKFKALCDQYQQLLRQARHLQRRSQIDDLALIDEQLSALEDQIICRRLTSADDLTAALQEIFPGQSPEILKNRQIQLREGQLNPGHLADLCRANVVVRTRQAVHAEILADMETPSEDQQLRLEIQVERLNKGFKQGVTPAADPLQLALNWVAQSAANDAQNGEVAACRKRFFTACRNLLE